MTVYGTLSAPEYAWNISITHGCDVAAGSDVHD